ncbi:hypothetical protein [Billgrantia montanilacus]|uniref:Uncharacterized protein n=1 Tax=Billgrantia montanilacus TaxID=2282305 RepID=A0A368TQ82_9GAMM|nr:hypothetical protein [Halomonas montanilacus]RCV86885.1 hypothetical protein DU505_18815 [Halomonas montanilacus]
MSTQHLPEISQLAFLLALAHTMPHRSQAMERQAQKQTLSEERARQAALSLLGIDLIREDRE